MPTHDYFPAAYCAAFGLPVPVPEYKFHPTRRWRIDAAWPDVLLACEVNGGVYTQGRHTRGTGYAADMENRNALNMQGWTVLEYEPRKIDYQTIAIVYQRLKDAADKDLRG